MQTTLPLPNPSDWLSIADAARELAVERETVYRMIRDGRLTRYEIGHRTVLWRADVATLAEALERSRVPRA